MKFGEALELLGEGKKIRKVRWESHAYIYKTHRGYIEYSDKECSGNIDINKYNFNIDEWEIYDDRGKIHKELSWLKEGHIFFSDAQYCKLKGCDNCPLRSFVVNGVELSCDSLSDIFYHLNNNYRLDK